MTVQRFGIGIAAIAAFMTVGASAHAGLAVMGSVGGAPTGVTKENFDALPLGTAGGTTATGISVSFSPDGAAVSGSSSGIYAAPFLSGGNGVGFGAGGTNQADGVDATTYLTSGATGNFPGAKVMLTLPGSEKYFGLLWGSVDAYNTLSFYSGGTLVGTVTGSEVTASPNGDRGVRGTVYVNIDATGSTSFDTVVATSRFHAFEFDNVAFNAKTIVPEPISVALLGSGLIGLGLARRKRS